MASLRAVWTEHPAPGGAPAAGVCCWVTGSPVPWARGPGPGFAAVLCAVHLTCFVAKVSGLVASPRRPGRLVAGPVAQQGSGPPCAAQRAAPSRSPPCLWCAPARRRRASPRAVGGSWAVFFLNSPAHARSPELEEAGFIGPLYPALARRPRGRLSAAVLTPLSTHTESRAGGARHQGRTFTASTGRQN